MPLLVVTFALDDKARSVVVPELDGKAEAVSLHGLDDAGRREALASATVLLARNTGTELRPGEPELISRARLVQFLSAGVDFVPLRDLPAGVPVAGNSGAYAEPMAEHALAMLLAAAKRLLPEHVALARGEFNQFKPNRLLAGGAAASWASAASGWLRLASCIASACASTRYGEALRHLRQRGATARYASAAATAALIR